MKQGYFIAGTDTEVGKTYFSAALIDRFRQNGARVAGLKPVAAGAEQTPDGLRNEDALVLQAHANVKLTYEQVNPVVFEPPIAPHIAANLVGKAIDVESLGRWFESVSPLADIVIVEGAGGWLVPLNNHESMADLASALNLPVLMVVGIKLGCINHALLTQQSIINSGCHLAGWVANRIDPDCDCVEHVIESLISRMNAPLVDATQFSAFGGIKARD